MADPLLNLARRAEERPSLLAALLAAFARSEDFDEAALAAHLGCAAGPLSRLKLCRAPHSDPEQMRKDVARLAEHFGISDLALRMAVLRGRVVLQMRQGDGMLLAARDRETEKSS